MSSDGETAARVLTSEVGFRSHVPDVASALAFVMDHLDKVGDEPTIEIRPVWGITESDLPQFLVRVAGEATTDVSETRWLV